MKDLIDEYVAAIQEIDQLQENGLEQQGNLKRHNKLAARIRRIAYEIESRYPQKKPSFYQLLYHNNPSIRIWSAHHLLEIMHVETAYRAHALKEIVHFSAQDSGVDGLGNKMWLDSWFIAHPEDKNLL